MDRPEPIPGPPPRPKGITSYPFARRTEHTFLADTFEGKAPRGPYTVEKFTYRDLPYEDHVNGWEIPYTENLRELALRFWLGSEYDIALMRREWNPLSSTAISKIYHVFNERTDMTARIVAGAEWKPLQCYHMTEKKMNYIQTVSFFLTYYNAVFFDDTIDNVSRLYFINPLSKAPGDVIRIATEDGRKLDYYKQDYWTPALNALYTKPNPAGPAANLSENSGTD